MYHARQNTYRQNSRSCDSLESLKSRPADQLVGCAGLGRTVPARWSAYLVNWSAALMIALSACAEQEPTAPATPGGAARTQDAQVQGVEVVPGKPATGRIRTAAPPAGQFAPIISPETPAPLGTEFPPGVMEAMQRRARSLVIPPAFRGIRDAPSVSEAPAAPSLFRSFLGFSQAQGNGFPPDNGLAAGPNHLVGAVNFTLKIFSKAGGQLASFRLLDWFSAAITVPGIFIFDPKVIFDAVSNRFVVVAVGTNPAQQASRVYVAVSRSGSAMPTSNWCVFEFDLRSQGQGNQWLDYPGLGNNNNAVIISSNRFFFGGASSLGSQVAWLEKAILYNCTTATPLLSTVTGAFTMQVGQSYINNNVSFLINSEMGSGGSGNTLRLWRTTSARFPFRATLTDRGQVPVTTFFTPITADQPGTNVNIQTGDWRLLNAVLRPSGLWTAHTTTCRPAGDAANRTCARFYQVNPNTNRVVQWNQFTASGLYYSFPAAVPDAAGNMVMVFNRSGASEFAGIRYSGRRATDPAGTMQPSALLRAGRGCYIDVAPNDTRNRFGDYSALAWDSGTQSFWAMAEFVLGNTQNCDANGWGTQIGQIATP